MNRYKIAIGVLILSGVMLTSCVNDLDTEPLSKRIVTSTQAYENPDTYKEFLAKLYGGMTLTGQTGQAGKPEISNPDEGQTSFMRMYWTAQEITTDESMGVWPDSPIREYNNTSFTEQNPYVRLLYMRIFINISFCNEFIREVSKREDSVPAEMKADVKMFLAEARFMRALYYSYAMDLWGNVPFVTENDPVGTTTFLPKPITRADLFTYIEKELLDIIPSLAKARENEYARADQATAWTLLARLYLNAKVYTGTERNTDCITYCSKIIDAGYSLHTSYDELFLADNDRLRNEIIFPIAEDGSSSQNYGGMTFVIHAAVGAAEVASDFGINSGWGGNRYRKAFVEKFDDISGETDSRAHINTVKHSLEIDHYDQFTEGYGCTKFKNMTSAGKAGKDATFVDTDFPLFRLADVYLMYAEAVKRGGTGGDVGTAVGYINLLRTRAFGDASGNIDASDLTLSFILDERARELYWEAQRRTDLVRFGQFTGGTYIWDWKGGVKAGKATDSHYDLFPIPSSERAINTNLSQNAGY